MKTHFTVALAMVAGFGLGAVAVQSLHAQAKPKAYTVSEIETLDAAAQAAYVPHIRRGRYASSLAFRPVGLLTRRQG